jgi:hypothetical protein
MKKARQFIVASLMLGTGIGNVQASGFCFKLNNYIDEFSLSPATIPGATLYVGNDYAIYGPARNLGYALVLIGGSSPLPPSGAARLFGFQGVNETINFGSHPNCTFYFISSEDPGSNNFTLNATCNGGVSGIWKKSVSAQWVNNCVFATPPTGAKSLGNAPSD